jgi:lysophospholipase L1-like esterase
LTNHSRSSTEGQRQKDEGQNPLRVIALGDSLAFGAGDESGSGIAGRLERELRQRGVEQIEATNLGVNGAQTSELAVRLQQPRGRSAVAAADAIVLSIGANDLFRTASAREAALRSPFAVAGKILDRIAGIVGELQRINPRARVLILGGYNPVPKHGWAPMIQHSIAMWDSTLTSRFAGNERVEIVKMSDLVTADRLSRYDSFHPGAAAYREIARRIADILLATRAA